jgi:hypothetical protein
MQEDESDRETDEKRPVVNAGARLKGARIPGLKSSHHYAVTVHPNAHVDFIGFIEEHLNACT